MDLGGAFAAALAGARAAAPGAAGEAAGPGAPSPPPRAPPAPLAALERADALLDQAERQLRAHRREGGPGLLSAPGGGRALGGAARALEEAGRLLGGGPRGPGRPGGQEALYLRNCRAHCSARMEEDAAALQAALEAEAAREERAAPGGAGGLRLELPAGPALPEDAATLEVTPQALRALELAPRAEAALGMRAVGRALSEVALMFRKASAAVQDQGQVIMRAEANTAEAAETMDAAVENLSAARKRLRGQRRKVLVVVGALFALFAVPAVVRLLLRLLRGK